MISLCDYLLSACFRQKQNRKNEPSVTKHKKFSSTYASLFFQHTLQILVTYNHLIKPLLRHKTMCFVFGLDTEEENLSWSAQTCTGNNRRRHTAVDEYLPSHSSVKTRDCHATNSDGNDTASRKNSERGCTYRWRYWAVWVVGVRQHQELIPRVGWRLIHASILVLRC